MGRRTSRDQVLGLGFQDQRLSTKIGALPRTAESATRDSVWLLDGEWIAQARSRHGRRGATEDEPEEGE